MTEMTKYCIPCSADDLRKLLTYDPESGDLFWKPRDPSGFANRGHGGRRGVAARWNSKWANKPALTSTVQGYLCGRVMGVGIRAHRAAWTIHHGFWPLGMIDHINGNRKDNRIANLRLVTAPDNARNARLRRDNSSGVAGVWKMSGCNLWIAQIGGADSRQYLGAFRSIDEAIAIRKAAEKRLGFHRNHGRASA